MSGPRHYHHGNLEQVLIKEATLIIGEQGVEKLSMRGLAERTGVSRTAAYHHFSNKNELLCAIAEAGFNNWNGHFEPLFQTRPEPLRPWLQGFVKRYVAFAQTHSEQYDLMFGRPVWKNGQPTDTLKAISASTFHRYVEFLRKWQNEGLFTNTIDGLRLAQVSWGMLHGICRLLNDGIYLDGEAVDSMCQAVVQLLLAGQAS